MRTVDAGEITNIVKDLCIQANIHLPCDVKETIQEFRSNETWETAQQILDKIIDNYNLADEKQVPICQDTGMACVFIDIGQDVFIKGDIKTAVDEGVRQGYNQGYLRKSVVTDPIERINSGDNTPAMLYLDIVPGDKINITVAPKGFGSENMSQIKMLKPSDGLQGVIDFVVSVVEQAGPNPCPPIIIGVGIGGTFDKAALIAKKALLRSIDQPNPNKKLAELEDLLLDKINKLGIGPQGFGGKTTALRVFVDTMPTHIAGLPCAVNVNCHVARHVSKEI